jgi:hypothetical protein
MHDDEVIPPTDPRYWTTTHIGVDYGSEPVTTVVATRCARCSHAFTARVDADLENEIAAHQERCFRVGDWVRWEHHGEWSEGEHRCHQPGGFASIRVAASSQHRDIGRVISVLVVNLRRIPRPGQEIAPRCCGQPMIAAKLRDDWHCHTGEISHYRTQLEIEAGRDMQRAAAEQGRQIAVKARAFNEARPKHLAAQMPTNTIVQRNLAVLAESLHRDFPEVPIKWVKAATKRSGFEGIPASPATPCSLEKRGEDIYAHTADGTYKLTSDSIETPWIKVDVKTVAERTQCCICGKYDTVSWECDHGKAKPIAKPPDPLDIEIDGLTLRFLLKCFRLNQQENETSTFTPAQRAAISAHWSAELRAKIAAKREAERREVRVDLWDEEEPW